MTQVLQVSMIRGKIQGGEWPALDESWIRDYWRDFNLCKTLLVDTEKDSWCPYKVSLPSLKGCGDCRSHWQLEKGKCCTRLQKGKTGWSKKQEANQSHFSPWENYGASVCVHMIGISSRHHSCPLASNKVP